MAFNDNEKINKADKLSLQIFGTANEAPGAKFWFNENNPNTPIVSPDKLWDDFTLIPGADTPTEATTNASNFPGVLERTVQRLTLDITSNSRAYIARATYNDNSSGILSNWIPPALIRNNGNASFGYSIRLFHGDPDGSGTERPTSYESGTGGAPSWEWNYSAGALVISTDKASIYKSDYDSNGLWILGYRYVGSTGGGASSIFPGYDKWLSGTGQVLYTLSNTPIADSEKIYMNGIKLTRGASDDYTISGNTLTLNSNWSIIKADWRIEAEYSYL